MLEVSNNGERGLVITKINGWPVMDMLVEGLGFWIMKKRLIAKISE